MTDEQLQQAIDKARAFLMQQLDYKTTPSSAAKNHAVETLKQLEKTQVIRANLAHTPTFAVPGAIIRCADNRPGCEKALGGLCDCAKGNK
jgi:hypothetical protein